MTPGYWERIRNALNEDAGTPAPEHFRIAADPATAADTTVTWTDAADDIEVQPPNEELDTFDPPEWFVPDSGVATPLLQKSARFTARIAIEITIELWTWIVDTGANSEGDWLGWLKYEHYRLGGSFNPLCIYAFNYLKRNLSDNRGRATCNYCPYKKLFGRPCNDRGTHLDSWSVARSYPGRKEHAQTFLEELLQVQKAIILDPKSVLPGSQQ